MNKKLTKLLALVLAVLCAVSLTACGSEQQVEKQVDAQALFQSLMKDVTYASELTQSAELIHGLPQGQMLLCTAGDEVADRLIWINLTNAADMQKALDSVDDYVQTLRSKFLRTIPTEVAKIDKAVLWNQNGSIILCITADYENAAAIVANAHQLQSGTTPPADTAGDTQTDTTTDTTEAPTESEEPLVLNSQTVNLTEKGQTKLLYEGKLDMSQITWTSSNTSVATFADGVVTAVGNGTAQLSATYKDQEVTCTVTCALQVPSGGSDRDPVMDPPTTQAVDSTFFDDAVFVGDSVSLKLSYYAGSSGELGNAKFLVRGNYSVGHAVYNSMLQIWQGQEMKLEDAVAAVGAKKVFIMLGMNDIALYGIDATIQNWGTMVSRIRSKSSDVQIYIQSMTPIWTGGETKVLTNANADKYNARLKEFAEANGCKFIDVAPYMKDYTNGLATKYCSDKYVHVTDAGVQTWIKVLKAYTGY